MPELPEVETIVRRLREILPGKKFNQVNVFKDKSFAGDHRELVGLKIREVSRRAKLIRIHLSNDLNLLTHLKMTGQLIYLDDDVRVGGGHPSADWVRGLPSNHTRIHYRFSDGSELFYNDMRIFGWMRLLTDELVNDEYVKLAPDITDPAVTSNYLYSIFQKRKVPIKQAIMNNQIVCGIGNIYASDALNLAKISPLRPAKSLSKKEVTRLLKFCRQVINRGIKLGGTTFDGKYVGVDGMAGGYQNELKAYGREGEKCFNCGGKIIKIKLGGRGTYYCDNCQR